MASNVLQHLEKEVVFGVAPSVARRAGLTISADQARNILTRMGVKVPGQIADKASLSNVLRSLTNLSRQQVAEFVKQASALQQ